jgi:hypothetical protein
MFDLFREWEHSTNDFMAAAGSTLGLRQRVYVARFGMNIDQQRAVVDFSSLVPGDFSRRGGSFGPWSSGNRRINELAEVIDLCVRLASRVLMQCGTYDHVVSWRSAAIFERMLDAPSDPSSLFIDRLPNVEALHEHKRSLHGYQRLVGYFGALSGGVGSADGGGNANQADQHSDGLNDTNAHEIPVELQHFSLYRSVLFTLAAFISQFFAALWWNHDRYRLGARLLALSSAGFLLAAFRSFGWL